MLFDNNNVDLNFTLYDFKDMNNMLNMNNIDKSEFLDAKEGFLKGNMFKNEYNPYKNLTYIKFTPKNDREAKLYNVMCYHHAIVDMNLYLDTHPNDRKAFNYLKELIKEEEMAKKEYIRKYGPLNISEDLGEKFEWIKNPWPWDNLGGNIYV